MTRKELKEQVEATARSLVWMWEPKEIDYLPESTQKDINDLMQLFDTYISKVIGQDENDPNRNARWQTYRNELRSEMRQRAGLEEKI